MNRSWEPLLHGRDRERALEIVDSIAAVTASRTEPAVWAGLMGKTGFAILLSSAQDAGVANEHNLLDVLESGIAEFFAGDTSIGLWDGAAGVRWAVSQLGAGEGSSMLLAHLDAGVEAHLCSSTLNEYDLYSGLAGVLLAYADDDICGDRILRHVLDQFERIDLFSGKRGVGCAHGIAGVLSALACCKSHGRIDERADPLMRKLVAALELTDVIEERVGWCRGELGIAIALLAAARVLADDDLANQAVELALAPLGRTNSRWPVDSSLCHGTAGLAHLYNRMYQATGYGRLAEHAHTWLCKTIGMQVPGSGVAGFSMRRTRAPVEWVADASLLTGASGVGLTLLAGVDSNKPSWDRLLGAEM